MTLHVHLKELSWKGRVCKVDGLDGIAWKKEKLCYIMNFHTLATLPSTLSFFFLLLAILMKNITYYDDGNMTERGSRRIQMYKNILYIWCMCLCCQAKVEFLSSSSSPSSSWKCWIVEKDDDGKVTVNLWEFYFVNLYLRNNNNEMTMYQQWWRWLWEVFFLCLHLPSFNFFVLLKFWNNTDK